jgi:hypothetical protein
LWGLAGASLAPASQPPARCPASLKNFTRNAEVLEKFHKPGKFIIDLYDSLNLYSGHHFFDLFAGKCTALGTRL